MWWHDCPNFGHIKDDQAAAGQAVKALIYLLTPTAYMHFVQEAKDWLEKLPPHELCWLTSPSITFLLPENKYVNTPINSKNIHCFYEAEWEPCNKNLKTQKQKNSERHMTVKMTGLKTKYLKILQQEPELHSNFIKRSRKLGTGRVQKKIFCLFI